MKLLKNNAKNAYKMQKKMTFSKKLFLSISIINIFYRSYGFGEISGVGKEGAKVLAQSIALLKNLT